jgi:hypothetical protein
LRLRKKLYNKKKNQLKNYFHILEGYVLLSLGLWKILDRLILWAFSGVFKTLTGLWPTARASRSTNGVSCYANVHKMNSFKWVTYSHKFLDSSSLYKAFLIPLKNIWINFKVWLLKLRSLQNLLKFLRLFISRNN